jgi:hypothetical protein
MNQVESATKRTLKSVSDFEQWLNEINLFAQEAQSELHDIAGILNVTLAGTSPRQLNPRDESGRAAAAMSQSAARLAESDDPLSSLQQKLAQQLKASRTATVGPAFQPVAPTTPAQVSDEHDRHAPFRAEDADARPQ